MNISDLLWNDFDIYQRRYLKSANALVAMRGVLQERKPIGRNGDEFLALFDRAAGFDAGLFTRVWSDPTAYFWTRLGYEFLGNCLAPGPLSPLAEASARDRGAKGDPLAALIAHLGDFKRYVLALAILSVQEIHFRAPLEVQLPFAIPATNLVIAGSDRLTITGFDRASIKYESNGKSASLALTGSDEGAAICREAPVARVAGYELPLRPEMFNLPGLAVGGPLLEVTPDFERRQLQLAEASLQLINRYVPDSFRHFRSLMRTIALKPPGIGDYTNISHSDLPGSFVCTVVPNEYWMADAFVHEFYHNRLFFIEEQGAFFANLEDNRATAGRFYSPWRNDLRPLHGLFHGLYVYIPLWRLWFAVFEARQAKGELLDAARDQILRTAYQLAIAVSQLRRYAEFSEFGARLFASIAAEVESICKTTRALRFPRDLPAMTCDDDGIIAPQIGRADGRALSVIDTIVRHAEQFDEDHQCEDLGTILAS